jgi:energy-coupling factor transporter transmembrane protein EcfT
MTENLTELMYSLIEHMEKERKMILFASLSALIMVPIGLLFNIISFLLISKNYRLVFLIARLFNIDGQSFRFNFIIVNLLITLVLIVIGLKNIQFISNWDKRLKEIRKFEKETYDELLKESDGTDR